MLNRFSTVTFIFLCTSLPASAQQYSYDGNLWYEVEASIFSNEYPGGFSSEISRTDKLALRYLPRLRQLRPATEGLMIEFPQTLPAPAGQAGNAVAVMDQFQTNDETIPWSPAVPEAFRLPNPDIEPWFSLDSRFRLFEDINEDLSSTSEHRLLWHKSWRQPVLPQGQVQALFVAGGQDFGAHRELEGSLRIASNRNQILIDMNLWLNRFSNGPVVVSENLELPDLPMQDTESSNEIGTVETPASASPQGSQSPIQVWQLEESRDLMAGEYYYLDHPALGVLVQIRPYVLPLPEAEEPADEETLQQTPAR